MRFQDIPGLSKTKKTLSLAVQNQHIAHAQLFVGPVGGAQLAMAHAFVTYLFCTNRTDSDACGVCPSCQKLQRGVHPDLVYVFPTVITKKIKEADSDAYLPDWRKFIQASYFRTLPEWLGFMGAEGNRQGNIPVEETRKLVQKISLKPFEAPFKVVMLWNPETLNAAAGNALLKTLEEPPSSTLFILVCAEPDKLLTTIISRTQRVQVGAVDVPDLADYLGRKEEIDADKAHQIAVNCEGNISEALEKSSSDNLSTTTWFAEWMRAIYAKNLSKLVQLADQFDGLAKENQKSILTYSLHIFRQCLYQISDARGLIKSLEKEKAFVDNFSKTLSTEKIAAMSEKISEVHYHLERNARAKMVHLDLSLYLLRVFHALKS